MKTNNKNKFIISISLVVVSSLLLVFFAFFLRGMVDSKKNSVLAVKEQLALYERRIEHINELEETLEKVKSNDEKIRSIFIKENTVVDFIEDLESLAERANVDLLIKGVRFEGDKDPKPLFTLNVVGSFEDVYRYYVLLENMPYKISFVRASLEKSSESLVWKSLLEFKILSFKNE